VHAFPFRMTNENMARHANHEAYPFWRTLKEGYDYFELTRQLPPVAVCNRHYVVNVALRSGDLKQLDPVAACPVFRRPKPVPFKPAGEQAALSPAAATPGRSGLSGSAMSTPSGHNLAR
jgi:murein L,D-transpeptidase YafK